MQTLNKWDRLKSTKSIEQLFKTSNYIIKYPIKTVWAFAEFSNNNVLQAAFTVSKKNFKHAVDRNLIKRRMREAYRKNKIIISKLLIEKNKKIAIMFIYSDDNIESYKNIETKIIFVLERLKSLLNN